MLVHQRVSSIINVIFKGMVSVRPFLRDLLSLTSRDLIDACDVDYHYLSFSILSYDSHRYQIVILIATTPKYSATFI